MLKTHSASAVVNSRLKVAPLFHRLDSAPNAPLKLSTDESAFRRRQQLIIMASHRVSQQAPEEQRKQRFSGFFPMGYKDAAYQWWTSCTPAEAERAVLRYMPHLKEAISPQSSPATSTPASSASSIASARGSDPYGNRIWRSTTVQLSGKNRALNEFSVERVDEAVEETLVMLHGYGAGLGFFYKNFEALTRQPGWKLYALDMLGMGNSSRPPFKITAKDQAGKITEAESWFIDALEEWRKIRKIDKFTLLGHSMGGYLAVSYALKYPGHLNKLILASPVGVPEDPYAVNAAMPEPGESTMVNEFIQDQQEVTKLHTSVNGSDNNNFLNARNKATASATAAPKRPIPGWLVWLWDANVSPFSIVRMAGPLGPRFVSGWTSRRFNHLPEDESKVLHEYSYGLFRQRGSGEYALPYLLAPGAYARSPVINRIHEVGRQLIKPATATTPEVRETGFPIVMMYGENDWMDVAGGFAAEEKIKQRCVKALMENTEEQRKRENGSAKVIIIPSAGHHLYLDNADNFNEIMREEMKETMEWGKKMKALDSQEEKN